MEETPCPGGGDRSEREERRGKSRAKGGNGVTSSGCRGCPLKPFTNERRPHLTAAPRERGALLNRNSAALRVVPEPPSPFKHPGTCSRAPPEPLPSRRPDRHIGPPARPPAANAPTGQPRSGPQHNRAYKKKKKNNNNNNLI